MERGEAGWPKEGEDFGGRGGGWGVKRGRAERGGKRRAEGVRVGLGRVRERLRWLPE